MLPRLAAVVLLGLLAFVLSAACAQQIPTSREITVTAREQSNGKMSFDPTEVKVKAGERVTFVVRNDGTVDHEFESDEAGIEEILVPPGRNRKVTVQAPSKAGSYPVYCDLPGHRLAGMELPLVVEE